MYFSVPHVRWDMECLFFCLTYFTQFENLQIHSCSCEWHYFILHSLKSCFSLNAHCASAAVTVDTHKNLSLVLLVWKPKLVLARWLWEHFLYAYLFWLKWWQNRATFLKLLIRRLVFCLYEGQLIFVKRGKIEVQCLWNTGPH